MQCKWEKLCTTVVLAESSELPVVVKRICVSGSILQSFKLFKYEHCIDDIGGTGYSEDPIISNCRCSEKSDEMNN